MSKVEIEAVSLSEGTGDRSLWRAVILQALDDAIIIPDASSDKERARRTHVRDNAILWLTRPNADFNRVCELAGFEPSQVRRLAIAHIENAKQTLAEREAWRARHAKRVSESHEHRHLKAATYTFNGHSLTLKQWSEKTGICLGTIRSRLSYGWTIERALTETSVWTQKNKQQPGVVGNFTETRRDTGPGESRRKAPK